MAKIEKSKITFFVNKLESNEKCFICGNIPELGNWNENLAPEMQYYQNEGSDEMFTLEVKIPFGTVVEYKYLSSRDWNSVECGIVAQELENRSITVKEKNSRIVIDRVKAFR